MKAILHGYIICDGFGLCQSDTLGINRAESWRKFMSMIGSENGRDKREYWKRLGFRCAKGSVTEANK